MKTALPTLIVIAGLCYLVFSRCSGGGAAPETSPHGVAPAVATPPTAPEAITPAPQAQPEPAASMPATSLVALQDTPIPGQGAAPQSLEEALALLAKADSRFPVVFELGLFNATVVVVGDVVRASDELTQRLMALTAQRAALRDSKLDVFSDAVMRGAITSPSAKEAWRRMSGGGLALSRTCRVGVDDWWTAKFIQENPGASTVALWPEHFHTVRAASEFWVGSCKQAIASGATLTKGHIQSLLELLSLLDDQARLLDAVHADIQTVQAALRSAGLADDIPRHKDYLPPWGPRGRQFYMARDEDVDAFFDASFERTLAIAAHPVRPVECLPFVVRLGDQNRIELKPRAMAPAEDVAVKEDAAALERALPRILRLQELTHAREEVLNKAWSDTLRPQYYDGTTDYGDTVEQHRKTAKDLGLDNLPGALTQLAARLAASPSALDRTSLRRLRRTAEDALAHLYTQNARIDWRFGFVGRAIPSGDIYPGVIWDETPRANPAAPLASRVPSLLLPLDRYRKGMKNFILNDATPWLGELLLEAAARRDEVAFPPPANGTGRQQATPEQTKARDGLLDGVLKLFQTNRGHPTDGVTSPEKSTGDGAPSTPVSPADAGKTERAPPGPHPSNRHRIP